MTTMTNPANLPPAIFLMGPTASGKSRIALDIARIFPAEIVSVDSAQVFRHMDIGTAKPDPQTLAEIPHHLINLIDPDDHYTAARFRSDALIAMTDISQRGKIPILSGGTMLYFRALQEGLSALPPADKDFRLSIEAMAKDVGWPALHQKLNELDPDSAARIKPTDSQRIQRALEVCYLTRQPMSVLLKTSKAADLPYRIIRIALLPRDRSVLHQRIADRFKAMLATGLIDEVQRIRQQFTVTTESPSMRCVGYRQTCLYLDNAIDLAALHDMGTAATRQLAKRQLTWLRGMTNQPPREFDCLAENCSEQVLAYLRTTI